MEYRVIGILIVLVTVYLTIGGVVFNALEGDNEQQSIEGSKEYINGFRTNNTCVSEEELDELLSVVQSSFEQGVDLTGGTSITASNWDIPNAIFFCSSVITTVGYGMLSPATFQGKMFCILYAVLGIPVFFLLMYGFGEKIYQFNSLIASKVNCFPRWPRIEAISDVLVVMALGVFIMVVLPAAFFSIIEDWNFSSSFYFCITSVSTIGFGDYVAGQNMEDPTKRAWYRMATIIWMSVGVAWWAGCLGVVQKHAIDGIAVRSEDVDSGMSKQIRRKAIKRKFGKKWFHGKNKRNRSSLVTVSEDYTVICEENGFVRDYSYTWRQDAAYQTDYVNENSFSTYL